MPRGGPGADVDAPTWDASRGPSERQGMRVGLDAVNLRLSGRRSACPSGYGARGASPGARGSRLVLDEGTFSAVHHQI